MLTQAEGTIVFSSGDKDGEDWRQVTQGPDRVGNASSGRGSGVRRGIIQATTETSSSEK